MILTPRQLQIAHLVAEGMGSKSIAREIGVSVQTVHDHIQCAASRLENIPGRPRHRLTLFVLQLHDDDA